MRPPGVKERLALDQHDGGKSGAAPFCLYRGRGNAGTAPGSLVPRDDAVDDLHRQRAELTGIIERIAGRLETTKIARAEADEESVNRPDRGDGQAEGENGEPRRPGKNRWLQQQQ